MTHNDIYTKFMIEYDKANITSSYPSLTEYEVATILDKAYNALIAQKVTGNNFRRAAFEGDLKSVSDLQPLIISGELQNLKNGDVPNVKYNILPEDFLYYVDGNIWRTMEKTPMDGETKRPEYVRLVSHAMAEKFFASSHNMPWIKDPVCYIEDNKIYIVYDLCNENTIDDTFNIRYIKEPTRFVNDLSSNTPFELNPTMAEELISLAIAFALENVESQRLTTKLNTRGLEA